MRTSWTISRYLIGAIVPYFVSAWLLLSVILFVQQASRFSDIFFSVNIPSNLIWQLAAALIPNVIAFTCPMAALVGIVIGLTKMQGDSELVAIRAAGVGNLQILFPVAILGLLLTGFTFLVNLYGVPFASRLVRTVAMQTAIYKLESPIEPGVFNTEVAGYTIYVKDGDITDGEWKNIFIHTENPKTGEIRLITSKQGRIDSSDQLSELVLEDGLSTTITPDGSGTEKFVSEKIGEVRFAIKTRRDELVQRLSSSESSVEELGLSDLSEYAKSRGGKDRLEAGILWQRRVLLSITPLIFAILGTVLVLRFNRGGRGFGIFISLVSLITYYLLAFLGEQLVRTGRIETLAGGLFPIAAALLAIIWFNFGIRIKWLSGLQEILKQIPEYLSRRVSREGGHSFFRDITTGLRDFDVLINLARYYLLTLGFLTAIFLIFTAFELWRYAGSMDGGVGILLRYLGYLLPFVYLQLAPSAAMVAILATFVIKSRQNEIVTWIAAGQSVYRLLVPCFGLMLFLGLFNFGVQEVIAPGANLLQDQFRQQLRSRGALKTAGRYWVADQTRIYSFNYNDGASDNERKIDTFSMYEFADKGGELQSIYRSDSAGWGGDRIVLEGNVRKSSLSNGAVVNSVESSGEVPASSDPFKEVRKKPSQLSVGEARSRRDASESEVERNLFSVAIERKWATLVLPFVIALFTAPFALSLNRKGKAATVGFAVGLWLVFMAATSVFEQFGLNGMLPTSAAVWTPLLLFAMLGVYLLSRVRT
ncbi:MAG TPA: LptF/LptG family permease [Pyrinomonadaceae bacterium]|nr:LptF/LptG family permease [Pyrinomonadaceae bacterium]